MAVLNSTGRSWNFQDLTGRRFGRLVVLHEGASMYSGHRAHVRWKCLCDCGGHALIDAQALRCGRTKSCGCLEQESRGRANQTHGMTKSREYRIYYNMINRCYDPKSVSWKWYGAKGVIVCDRWLESFKNFYADMGACPSTGHSIDRIDNGKEYTKVNCRWATAKDQANNRSTSKHH